jgi:arylsulfatase A-like enzyme/Flp pilus assembly protein TadD
MKSTARFRISIFFLLAIALFLLPLAMFYHRFYTPPIRNVVVISIDTCRADYLGCYGFAGDISPRIDEIASESILFENAVTPMPLTLPGHCSMLTGRIPPYHRIHDNEGYVVADSEITLAEILTRKGFATGAVISSFVLDSRFGLSQGFYSYNDTFDESLDRTGISERRGAETTKYANAWLDKHKDERFFLFLHYFDPHYTYEAPEPFSSTFDKNPYAAEIAYVDHCIGQVIDKLKQLDLYDSTLLIITSDHGEGLGEHGESYHGYYIYQGTVRVPMILKFPKCRRGVKFPQTTGLIDIVPTVCGLLKIEPPSNIQGRDLSAYLHKAQTNPENKSYYCESLLATQYGCNPLLGIISEDAKYIHTTRPELYDLQTDPAEKNDLIKSRPDQAKAMQKILAETLDDAAKDVADAQNILDTESKAKLESLGYVSGGMIKQSYDFDQSRPDPKDMIEFHVLNSRAGFYVHEGKFAQVEKICEKLLQINDEYPETYNHLGRAVLGRGDNEKARECFARYVELRPTQAGGYNNLALALTRLDDRAEAAKVLEKSIELNPDFAQAHFNLGRVLGRMGQFEKAISHLNRAKELAPTQQAIDRELQKVLKNQQQMTKALNDLQTSPDSAEPNYEMARIYHGQDKLEQAFEHCTRALEDKQISVDLRLKIINLLLRLARLKTAVAQLELILDTDPGNLPALNTLAWVLAVTPDETVRAPDRAVQLAQKVCQLTDYKLASVLDTFAAALASAGRFDQAVKNAEKAIELAESAAQQELQNEIKDRLKLYKKNQPYYDLTLTQKK